jgi:hypothetical protein
MSRPFATRAASATSSVRAVSAVTPDDAADLPKGVARALFVGGGGDVVIEDAEGNVVTLASGSHQYHPIEVKRVRASGTTATALVALY